jgi:hypothetical protein
MDILNNKIWLVKVPEMIYDELLTQNEIGIIDIITPKTSLSPNHPIKNKPFPKTNVRLSKAFKVHNFNLHLQPTECYITFKDKKNKSSKVKQVNYLGRLIASDEKVSDDMVKEINDEYEINKPKVLIDESHNKSHAYLFSRNETFSSFQKKKTKKEPPMKRTRMPVEDLKSEIFKLFSETDFITAKEIGRRTDQPDNFVKEVLSEICEYIKTGPKKGYYELKREYVKSDNLDMRGYEDDIDEAHDALLDDD